MDQSTIQHTDEKNLYECFIQIKLEFNGKAICDFVIIQTDTFGKYLKITKLCVKRMTKNGIEKELKSSNTIITTANKINKEFLPQTSTPFKFWKAYSSSNREYEFIDLCYNAKDLIPKFSQTYCIFCEKSIKDTLQYTFSLCDPVL